MSETNNNVFLSKVKAPQLGSSFATSFTDMINTINDNFTKLASAPFLKGDDANPFVTETVPVWVNDTVWKLTDDGAMLLNAVFSITSLRAGMSRSDVEGELHDEYMITGGYYPTDSFFSDDTTLTNNSIYFLVTYDDAGNVSNKALAQYYFFVDERIKYIESASVEDKKRYQDTSGFVRYIPQTGNEAAHYERMDIIPTIYYDRSSDCMCWKYNGKETGIPSTGVPGSDGTNAHLIILKCEGAVGGENGYASHWLGASDGDTSWHTDFSELTQYPYDLKVSNENSKNFLYPALICLVDASQEYVDTMFGVFKLVNNGGSLRCSCFWETDSRTGTFVNYANIKYFFDNIGVNDTNTGLLRGLKVPSYYDADSGNLSRTSHSHLIYADDFDGDYSDLHIGQVTGDGASLTSLVETRKTLFIDNYDLNVNGDITAEDIDASNINASAISATALSASAVNAETITATTLTATTLNATTLNASAINATTVNAETVKASVGSLTDVYLGCPIGTIVMWYGGVTDINALNARIDPAIDPENTQGYRPVYKVENDWLLCNGALLGKDNVCVNTEYKKLFDYLNIYSDYAEYSEKNGLTYIEGCVYLPDMIGRVPVGAVVYSENTTQTRLKYTINTGEANDDIGNSKISLTSVSDYKFPYFGVNFIIKFR